MEMTDGISASATSGSFYRSVASIPSRRSLNVQLGPTAGVAEDSQLVERPLERQQTLAGCTTSLEPWNPGTTQRTTPRRRVQPRQQAQPIQPELQQQPTQQQQQRLRWSRMSTSTAAMSAPLSLTSMTVPTSTETSAGLCQLVDFGETRELIRRHREAAKKSAEVHSIVTHLNLEKENNSQEPRTFIGWATFRRQGNSQFKQYVFQAPGRTPYLPVTGLEPSQHQQQHQQLQRSKTTLGLVAGRAAARHSRPEPLGATFKRELSTLPGATAVADLRRESSSLSMLGTGLQQSMQSQPQYKSQGHSSNAIATNSDCVYGQFERRRTRTYHLD